MWYNVFDGANALTGYATSPDGFTWAKHASNPVLEPGPEGAWDDEGVFNDAVIYKDDTYHMWYTGWDGTNTRIGLATSSDGFNWTKSAGNPVMDIGSIGSWDDAGIGGSSVVFNGTTYLLWYSGSDLMQVGTPFGAGKTGIGYATSPDGIIWNKFEENPVLTPGVFPAWDLAVIIPNVIFDGIKYQMWYSGFGIFEDSFKWRIGYAVSLNPFFTSISDVPEDQGGWVFLNWVASSSDFSGQIAQYGVSEYNVDEGWVSLGSVQAEQKPNYTFLAHTFGNFTADDGIFWSKFIVTAHTTDPEVYYTSEVDSGFSVDNLAPALPTGLLATPTDNSEIILDWDAPIDEDFKYFAIYRSVESGFDPTGMEPHALTIDIKFTDTDITVSETYYYRLSAFDENGNESNFSQEVSAVITGVDGERAGLPNEYSLAQNYPNPFNPVTIIEFAIPTAIEVSLLIYSLKGEEVVWLIEGEMPAGYHQVTWNASDVSSGIYFYRLKAGDFVQTRKMVLLR